MKRFQSYPYDRSSFIARPTLAFYITPPDAKGGLRAGRALLDTGATHCFIPREMLSELAVEPVAVYRVENADGAVSAVDAYDVMFSVPQHFSERIRVLATNSEEPLIGRDVMDHWRITFDGPNKQIEVEPVL